MLSTSARFLIPMTTVKREKMVDEVDVDHTDELELNIEMKREEGEMFGRDEQIRWVLRR